jgi:uncharacterized protein (TIGR02284 family)
VRFAAEQKVDLIVIGTHGYGGIGSVIVGSVAEKVMQGAPCPVLAVKPSAAGSESDRTVDAVERTLTDGELSAELERLVKVCIDCARVFREAAAAVADEGLKLLFEERATQREGFAEELQAHAVAHGRLPERKGSLAGSIQRNWRHLKALVAGSNTGVVLDACLHTEEIAQRAYEQVLRHGIPQDVRRVLDRQRTEVLLIRESLQGLKNAGVAR